MKKDKINFTHIAEIAVYVGIVAYVVKRLYNKFKAMKNGDLELYLEGNSTGIVANRRSLSNEARDSGRR